MNVITAPPKGPFVTKELPQRSTRRGAAALRDISNQVAVSNPTGGDKKSSKAKGTAVEVTLADANESRDTSKKANTRKRKSDAKPEAGFTVFDDSVLVQKARSVKVSKTQKTKECEGAEQNSKENDSNALEPSRRVKNGTKSLDAGSTVEGVVTLAVPSVSEATAAPVQRRSSSRNRQSLESSENVAGAEAKSEKVVAGAASRKRKSSETAPTKATVTAAASTSSVPIVVEGKVSVVTAAAEEEAKQDAKKACTTSSLIRTVPKRNLNPAKCSDIIERMYDNFYDMQRQYTAQPYLHKQRDINAKMRAILVDWIVEVHYKFKLHQSTLWLTINVIDRYLEVAQTMRSDLQLVGVSALLIACKFEEVYPPEVRDCVYITDYAYSREQVLQMESKILCHLDYHICVPTAYHFLTRYLNSFHATELTRHLAFYYAERNLQEYDMLDSRPCKFAAYALYAALCYREPENEMGDVAGPVPENVWTPELQALTGLEKDAAFAGAHNILKHVQEETVTASKRQLIAAKKKYAAEKYNTISTLPIPQLSGSAPAVPGVW